jgi:hypothetical protein
VLAVVAGLFAWINLINPQAKITESLANIASVAYPVMDLLVLAVALRLVLGPPAAHLVPAAVRQPGGDPHR